MKKTFHFKLPEVGTFSNQVKVFLPKLADSSIQRYEDTGIQLIEEYIDYHSVIFYRLQCHIQQPTRLSIETVKADYHLLYNLGSPQEIVIEQPKNDCQVSLPAEYHSYVYIPKGKLEINLIPGTYLLYGVLVDIGFIRPAIYKENHFLSKFRAAHRRDKKRLYQSAIWPVKERTRYQLSYTEAYLFKYRKENEAIAIKVVYDLFDIAIDKNFDLHEKIDPDQLLARLAQKMVIDQVTQIFSRCSIQAIAEQLQVDKSKLNKIYKTIYGESPKQTWNKHLILKAKELLLMGHSVKEVSNYCGYGQQQNFSTFFQKQTGICPSQYK
ncbi:helix-turn-helix transcriptional regulator [Sphingobacterium sp. HMA12]|uniref:helix-turn-helix transcriptional regulator n=1 Tax=Sphingobacterium sp. HMA12 TaxID=2050894 RepID=UPI000CE9E736|nr:helix-turn-helix transcriptional regulator [Sphingobacterium sp. HMA12]